MPPDLDALAARLRAAGCVFAEDEARLLLAQAADDAELARLVARRVAGEPLEQVLGWAELDGVRVRLAPGVFVPRRRTAVLAREAVRRARAAAGRRGRPPLVVDLCCGSGAIAAVVLAALPGAEVHAADVDPAAVACARTNLPPSAAVHVGDLYAALPPRLAGRVDVVVANAPYVPTAHVALLAPEARLHEPRAALDGGPDGLDVVRAVLASAGEWLAGGGCVLVEAGDEQSAAAQAAAEAAGLVPDVVVDDELETTVVVGVLTARRGHGGPAAAPGEGQTENHWAQ